jgi:hypothetical protein
MRESIAAQFWWKSSAFNLPGATIFNALAEISSVLIMQNLLTEHDQ